MPSHRPQLLWRRRRRRLKKYIVTYLSTFLTLCTMSSRQISDAQYAQFQAAWLAAQRGAPQLNFPTAFDGFEGPSSVQGLRHGNNFYVNSSSVFPGSTGALASHPSDAADHASRAVAQADHENLMLSGNDAYANALALHRGTKAELDSLR